MEFVAEERLLLKAGLVVGAVLCSGLVAKYLCRRHAQPEELEPAPRKLPEVDEQEERENILAEVYGNSLEEQGQPDAEHPPDGKREDSLGNDVGDLDKVMAAIENAIPDEDEEDGELGRFPT
mmetsp:Transcript_124090/g.247189  ORF Transcript_124090/g.247189 Transcript_124090/m.247189 type:complete len:122 (+) Transcript_124090:93-458(+)